MKRHSGSSKRFKVTATGKVKRKKAFKNHILDCKTTKQKRHLSSKCLVHKSDMDRVKHMLVL